MMPLRCRRLPVRLLLASAMLAPAGLLAETTPIPPSKGVLRLPPIGGTTADIDSTTKLVAAPRPLRLLPPPDATPRYERLPISVSEPVLAVETLPAAVTPEPPSTPLEPMPAVLPVSSDLAVEGVAFCDFCGDGCSSGSCCEDCRRSGRWGRFGRAVYRGLCCPDPCYDPQWRPRADTAFFTTAVRPQNQQRFRWDYAEDLTQPDRAEYLWARSDGGGKGPGVFPSLGVDYDELRHYTEVAHGAFGASFEYSYRSIDAAAPTGTPHTAGFGDLTIGIKSLLFDTELVQVAFQMLTHIPQGDPSKALGVGHTSLEPGLVFGLNLSPNSYVQAEVSEWIPLGGDSLYAGAIFRYNAAYNHVLARPHPCVPLIGTLELNGWRFQDGAYTDPANVGVSLPASGVSFLQTSAGVRMFFCERADFGVSYATAATSDSWADTLIRTELRFRY